MARYKKTVVEPDSETHLDISSLIDVCFLVLIYFIVAMTVIPAERDLVVALPGPGETDHPQPPIPAMVLRIDAQGNVFSGAGVSERILDSDPASRDLPILSGQLKVYHAAARSAGDFPSVLLRVDGYARQQRLIDVLNALAAAAITTVVFEDLVSL